MPPRSYDSSIRRAAAADKRRRLVEAAGLLLREKTNIAAFSLEAVARMAGVTRLTVYNQFGSRRGLLEAVFDERAHQGGLERIGQAMAMADASAALDRLIGIFCDFWGSDPAIGLLHEAIALDPEFALAVTERNERRRGAIGALLRRIVPQAVDDEARAEAVDLIFTLTGYATFHSLRRGRSKEAACTILQDACHAAVERLRGR